MDDKLTLTDYKLILKRTGPIILFSIIPPLFDVLLDLKFIFHLYSEHPVFASMLLGRLTRLETK